MTLAGLVQLVWWQESRVLTVETVLSRLMRSLNCQEWEDTADGRNT